ncbi:hypothetical protein [Mangrovibacterium lignilyticum]|uniref:hypothetical protein n=1 Tax=Mangrovibacterium lignilyticum TaxID=2668052 RepID=UPI0013D4FE11|nr:hypothetical protein [Mangrovibacterium lignilyticum]
MGRLTKFINGNIAGKTVLGLFVLTNALYGFMLTVTIPKTMAFAHGMKLPDMLPGGYDLSYVNELFSSLGEIGRTTYLTNQLPVDMIYPLFFGLTYSLLLAYFLKKLNKLNVPFTYLCLLPVIAGAADYLENAGLIFLLKSYPDLTALAVKTTSTFSVVKSVSTSVFFVVLLIVLIMLGIKALSKIKTSANRADNSAKKD